MDIKFTYEKQTNGSVFQCCVLNTEQQLDDTAVGMLLYNSILGILPLAMAQVDKKRILRYNITDMKPAKVLFDDFVDRQTLLGFLGNLCDLFFIVDEYLLDQEMFSRDLDRIFISQLDGRVWMTYLPLVPEGNTPDDLRTFFQQIMDRTRHSPWEELSYATELLDALESVQFRLRNFRILVQRLYAETNVIRTTEAPQAPSKDTITATNLVVEKPKDAKRLPGMRFLFGMPKGVAKPPRAKGEKKRRSAAFHFAIPNVDENMSQVAPEPSPMAAVSQGETPHETLEGETVTLIGSSAGRPTLVRRRTGEKIPINKQEFFIGSAPEADYQLHSTSAVSAMQVKFLVRGGKCYAVNLEPASHTVVEGIQLLPQVEMLLHAGCTITLADEWFLFQI